MLKTKTTRICAGEYEVRPVSDFRPHRKVSVSRVHYPGDGAYWIAAAAWDPHRYTDPLPTKRDAVFNANAMLNDEA